MNRGIKTDHHCFPRLSLEHLWRARRWWIAVNQLSLVELEANHPNVGGEISLNFPRVQERLNGSAGIDLTRKMLSRYDPKLAVVEVEGTKVI
jgi:hypothetical protein